MDLTAQTGQIWRYRGARGPQPILEECSLSSKHLVDPQLVPLIEQLPGFDLGLANLDDIRAMMIAMGTANQAPPADDVVVTEHRIPGPEGAPDVRVLVSAPKAQGASRPGVLHVHGGGYILGAPEMTLETDAAYARAFEAVCVSVDYRLAPETPHPGPVEDCYAALKWLHRNAEALGVDTGRIVVTGESAGGGLAAALVLLARDRAEIPVAFQHLVFPMLDDRTGTAGDPSPFHGEFLWTRPDNRFGWTSLLGAEPGSPDISYYAAPARAPDLTGLPPTFICCGALDLFLEEDMEYARRLIRAGVPTELHIYPGAPHGFMFVADAHVTRAYARDSMAALERALTKA
jgi:acetyl esterase/lipase